jgi:dihydrodipicolinate synthase/N-acetylneuraminate lyase
MQSPDLHGVMVALPTPFTKDGSAIDIRNLHDHVDWIVRAGVHGLVPGGSTGEFTALSIDERKTLTAECVAAAGGRVPVIAGTGALTNAVAVDLAVHAAHAGASALMVVPPFYDAPTLSQLERLLAEIHAASGLPIMYYNIPSATGVRLTVEEIAGLGGIDGVRWMKDTSGDAVALTALLVSRASELTVFNGWDTLTFAGLAAGARGTVWGATNLIPELSVQLWDALAVRGDLAGARDLWSRIWPICDFLEAHPYAAAVKTGLDVLGRSAGPVRRPAELLDPKARDQLASLLSAAALEVGSPS